MVVMRMRIRRHCTIDLRDNSSVGKAQNWKGKCCTTLARLIIRSTINIAGRLHFPEHEDDCMEAYPLNQGLYLDLWSWHVGYYSIGDQHHWTRAIILAICDTFTLMVASQA